MYCMPTRSFLPKNFSIDCIIIGPKGFESPSCIILKLGSMVDYGPSYQEHAGNIL